MRSLLGRSKSLVPGDACRRGTAFGLLEPARLKSWRAMKVARYNRRSNLPRRLALIHDRGMKRHKAKRLEASMRPHENGLP